MSVPANQKHPVTEFPLESYIRLIMNDPDHRNARTPMRGLQNNILAGDIQVGRKYNMSKNDVRTVVYAYSHDIIFYRDDEEKLFRQDTVGFSISHQFSAFTIAGEKSIGTVYFASIVMGLISAGFATISFPAFALIFITETAQTVSDVKNDPVTMAIIKFIITYWGIQEVLKRLAPTLSEKLFDHLLKQIKSNTAEHIDPESVMKILVTLAGNILKRKLGIKDRMIRRSQNKIGKGALAFQVVMGLGKLLYQVIKVLPLSIYKTGSSLHAESRKMAMELGTSLRNAGVWVSQEDYAALIIEFENIVVLEKLIELREAAQEVVNELSNN